MYENIKLDNNFELSSVTFRFFKKQLFQIFFNITDDIHNGLSAKYGYEEIDETTGVYGNFKDNIRFFKVNVDDKKFAVIQNEKISKLSESEGF